MKLLDSHNGQEKSRRWNIGLINSISLIIVLVLLQSCKQDENLSIPLPPKGEQCLGAGYDVFDNYADVYKLKAVILDIDKLNADGKIEMQKVENSTFTTTSGTTIEEYQHAMALSASLGLNYYYFSGAIRYNFLEEYYTYESYSFATVKSLIQKSQLRLPIDMTHHEMKPYLTEKGTSVYAEASFSQGGVSVGGGVSEVIVDYNGLHKQDLNEGSGGYYIYM